MQTTRIVEAVFNGGRTVTTRGLYQYDYGQLMTFPDLTVPAAYQVQFCVIGDTETLEVIGDESGVMIPDELLTRGQMITAYVYLHDTETDGETRYTIAIPVSKRPEISDIEPTPEEQRQIDILIAALGAGVTRSETAADEAEESAAEATASASAAAISADRAEQAAATAGWMELHIDENGHLIYERTANTETDFVLENGRLIVEAI